MPKNFIVAPLPADRIAQAFPVVQPMNPALTPALWQGTAELFLRDDESCGIMACRMGTGHIRGLFCYVLDDARALRVGPFAVAGLFDARSTAEGLIGAIDHLARRFGAERVTVDLGVCSAATVPRCDLPTLFHEHGYHREGGTMVWDSRERTMSRATA